MADTSSSRATTARTAASPAAVIVSPHVVGVLLGQELLHQLDDREVLAVDQQRLAVVVEADDLVGVLVVLDPRVERR